MDNNKIPSIAFIKTSLDSKIIKRKKNRHVSLKIK
jgi:hypothetical protein